MKGSVDAFWIHDTDIGTTLLNYLERLLHPKMEHGDRRNKGALRAGTAGAGVCA